MNNELRDLLAAIEKDLGPSVYSQQRSAIERIVPRLMQVPGRGMLGFSDIEAECRAIRTAIQPLGVRTYSKVLRHCLDWAHGWMKIAVTGSDLT